MQAVWSACESCMRACLATCRLACDTKRVQQAQRARCRARPPSSPRRCHERLLLCKTKERTVLQRCKLFARDLQRGPGLTCLRSPLKERSACHAMPRRGASLRAAFAPFFALANAFRGRLFICRCNASHMQHAVNCTHTCHTSIYRPGNYRAYRLF